MTNSFFTYTIHTFQNDYENEGVADTKLYSFPDNRHLLELFLSKKTGIMDLIETETKEGTEGTIDGE